MPESVFEFSSDLPAARAEAFAWHERPGALQRLIPPWQRVDVLENQGIRDGARVVLKVPAPWPRRWVAVHEGYEPGCGSSTCKRRGRCPLGGMNTASSPAKFRTPVA